MPKNKPFRIQVSSSAPEIKIAEVFLPNGEKEYKDGWFVTTLSEKAFEGEKVLMSAFPKPDFQVAGTFDFRAKQRRIAFLLGKTEPLSRLIVSMPKETGLGDENKIVVYWKDWQFEKAEWNDEKLEEIKDTTPVRVDIKG